MKMKNICFLALAAMTALCLTACSSDDDDNSNDTVYPVTLTTPATADQAAHYELPTPLPAASADDDAPQLKAIDITESSKILVELRDPETKNPVYVMDDVKVKGNIYELDGSKVKGTIEVKAASEARLTRADGNRLKVDLTVRLSDTRTARYVTDADGYIVEVTKPAATAADDTMDRLARTWTILGATLDLKCKDPKVTAYEEFDSRNGIFDLNDVMAEAVARDVKLSDKEKKEFDRQVKSVTVTRTNKFIVTYANGTEDVAVLTWTNAAKTSFNVRFNGQDMGNKFLNDDTRIDVAFNGNRCNLKGYANVSDNDNKNWDVVLLLKLQDQQ